MRKLLHTSYRLSEVGNMHEFQSSLVSRFSLSAGQSDLTPVNANTGQWQ
jgi:hypothetical protein